MKKIVLFLALLLLPVIRANAVIYIEDFEVPQKAGEVQNNQFKNDYAFTFYGNGEDVFRRSYYYSYNPSSSLDFGVYLNQTALSGRYYAFTLVYGFYNSNGDGVHRNLDDSITNIPGTVDYLLSHSYSSTSFFEVRYSLDNMTHIDIYGVSITTYILKTTSTANAFRFHVNASGTSEFRVYGYQLTFIGEETSTLSSVNNKVNEILSNMNKSDAKIDKLSDDMKMEFKLSTDLAKTNSANEINAMNKNSQAQMDQDKVHQQQTIQNFHDMQDKQQATTNSIDKQTEQQRINQQQTIQNLHNLQDKQQATTDATNKQTDYLKDDTPPDSDISVLGNVTGVLPPGPLDSLLNIPFKFLSVLTSSFSGTCVPMNTTWVFGKSLTIPCFSEMFWDKVPIALMTFLDVVPAIFILIKYFKHLYKKIDRAVSMETNSDDEWGVI